MTRPSCRCNCYNKATNKQKKVAFKANSDVQNVHVKVKVQDVDPGKVFTYKKEIIIGEHFSLISVKLKSY